MPRIAALAALVGVSCLLVLGDPGANAVPSAVVLVAWGLAVVLARPRFERPRHVVIAALLIRLPLLLLPPTFSDDVWRYVWEGEVWRAGHNPFILAPNAPELAPLRDAVWAHVNHRDVPSIYPPFAQLLFVLLADGGVPAWRVLSLTADVATAYLLARARPEAGGTWALLPLPAVESAVSGHLEGVGVLFLVAAITTRRGLWAWLGAMVKLLPGVLLVLEPRRRWPGWALLTALVAFPIVRPTGFETYRASWAFNGSIFPLLEAAVGASARPLAQAIGAAIVAAILFRSRDPARIALWTTGAFVALSPTVHPWYVLWAAAAAALVPLPRSPSPGPSCPPDALKVTSYFAARTLSGVRPWLLLAALVPLSYVVLGTRTEAGWVEWVGTRWLIYTPFYISLAMDAWRRATRAGPWSVG